MKKQILVLSLFAVLSACAGSKESKEIVGTDVSLYNQGMDALQGKKYSKAINLFEELDRQHPYSSYAQKGQVMTIFAKFENEDYDEVIFEADAFIQENVGFKNLAYIYYLKGLADYYRISDPKRDQGHTKNALATFQALVNRFPDSKYAEEAEQKIILCQDHLASKEMEVGRYYQSTGNMLAAANRFQTVVNEYQRSSQTPEALYRIAEVYTALGLNDEAVRALSILGYNYSGQSVWYEKGYDLLTNIDDYERKYKDQDWYQKFTKGVGKVFDN